MQLLARWRIIINNNLQTFVYICTSYKLETVIDIQHRNRYVNPHRHGIFKYRVAWEAGGNYGATLSYAQRWCLPGPQQGCELCIATVHLGRWVCFFVVLGKNLLRPSPVIPFFHLSKSYTHTGWDGCRLCICVYTHEHSPIASLKGL